MLQPVTGIHIFQTLLSVPLCNHIQEMPSVGILQLTTAASAELEFHFALLKSFTIQGLTGSYLQCASFVYERNLKLEW